MATVEKATFAAGCFWGVQKMFDKHFMGKGVISSKVGYIGGHTEQDVTYEQVCTDKTGHAEAIELSFDPSTVNYDSLVEFFYRVHDPTTKNAQGQYSGTQYRSSIFYHSEEQKVIAEAVTKRVQEGFYKDKTVVTEILPATTFYAAEDYHQKYVEVNPGENCQAHFLRW